MSVKGKGVEYHGTDEGDVCCLTVIYSLVGVNPQTSKLRQDVDGFERFQVVDKDIWEPELVDQLQVDRNHGLFREGGGVDVSQEHLWYLQSGLCPHHVKV